MSPAGEEWEGGSLGGIARWLWRWHLGFLSFLLSTTTQRPSQEAPAATIGVVLSAWKNTCAEPFDSGPVSCRAGVSSQGSAGCILVSACKWKSSCMEVARVRLANTTWTVLGQLGKTPHLGVFHMFQPLLLSLKPRTPTPPWLMGFFLLLQCWTSCCQSSAFCSSCWTTST